jgi:hypothetical protein
MMEWLKTRNNPFEEDMVKEDLMVVVDGIWLKSDACKTDDVGEELSMQFFTSVLITVEIARGQEIIAIFCIKHTLQIAKV